MCHITIKFNKEECYEGRMSKTDSKAQHFHCVPELKLTDLPLTSH